MKKILLLLPIALLLACAAASAQDTSAEEYLGRYQRLIRNVGESGVGVETLLDRWEADWPDDLNVPVARFNYYFHKALRTEILPKPGLKRFLGNAPAMTLKDNDGQDVPYFEENFFDDELFGEAIRVLDQQIAAHPDELRYRYLKISALAAYEKEQPDMTAAEIRALIARQTSAHPAWTLDGQAADEELFQQGIGEFCYTLFQTGSPAGYEFFHEISERMSKLYPKNPVFIDNIGSYWQVAQGNDKQAAKYYKKALKLDPDDYAAQRNLQIIEKKQQAAKKKK